MPEQHLIIGILIFSLSYIMIVSEKLNRTVVALFGAVLMILFQVVSQEEALEHIDFNTLGLLIGMMIIVNIIKRTGLFQYLAIKTAKLAKGDPVKIILYFSIIAAVASGLLDNVTTILLIVPVTLVISDTLKINPVPFIISEIMAANIGGAATLIGDPPNIMIGSFTGLSFVDFVINLAPIMLVIFIVTIFFIKIIYRKSLKVSEESRQLILKMDERKAITDKKLLIKSLIVLFITIGGFTLAEQIGMESASVAIFGASLLLLISRIEPEEILVDVEWVTIFFFGGLFVLVGSLESIGVISILAEKLLNVTQGDLGITTILVLWMSAILSSFLDNIPYVATMIPLVNEMESLSTSNFEPVWWALSIGACLGGNGTIIGASANVVARGIVERNGHKITFLGYMKIAFPLMIMSIMISTIYLLVFYL
ncbi:SLC13 family permease [Candidatus Izimaplasma bacterium ZiA1]|uniref:SLC13 family permease n=1 Tax=Candidatus Izimoplasma sp. ZiA1 TaxID=2024899 RepID=UPI00210F8AF3